MLLTLGCAFLACTQPLPTAPDSAPLLAQASGGIEVAYFCGNTFQFRNRSLDTMTVAWRVHGVQEDGKLFLPANGGAAYSETYLTTRERGPLQVSRGGQLITTVPNKHTAQCEIPVTDTTTPPMPESMSLPADTSNGVIGEGMHPSKYYGNLYAVAFADTTSGTTIRAFLRGVNGAIIGGLPIPGDVGYYIVQVPERSTTWAGIQLVQSAMLARPGVSSVLPVKIRSSIDFRGRYPILPSIAPSRKFWSDLTHEGTRAFVAIRAPLAWGCETGLDGPAPSPVIGIVDLTFDPNPAIVNGALRVNPDPNSLVAMDQNALTHLGHGTGIAGIISSDPRIETANPGQPAIAGMLWSSALKLYQVGTLAGPSPMVTANTDLTFIADVGHAGQNGVQVLSTSISVGDPADPQAVKKLHDILKKFLDGNDQRVFVFALGNDGLATTASAVAAGGVPTAQALDRAVATLILESKYRDRILVVSATDEKTGALLIDSNVWTDVPSIAAPGDRITTLLGMNQLAIQHGTSFAAAFVAGLAGQAVRHAPALKGIEIVKAIRDGGSAPRFDPTVGGMVTPQNAGRVGIYQIDAYSTLHLASASSGAAFCGNSLWAEGSTLYAERLPGTKAPITTLPGPIGQILSYHGGRKLVVQDLASGNLSNLEMSAAGTWSATGPWDEDLGGSSGSAASTYGYNHDRDSLYFTSGGAVWEGSGFLQFGERVGTLPQVRELSSSSGGNICVKQYKNDGNWECYNEITSHTAVQMGPTGSVTTMGQSAILFAQDVVRFQTEVDPVWTDCFTYQPATDDSGCRFHWAGDQVTTLASSVWRMDRRTGSIDSLTGMTGRYPILTTGAEDGGSFVVSSGILNPTGSYSDCRNEFYTLAPAGTPLGAPVIHPYASTCEGFEWQGGFAAVRQHLTSVPRSSPGGFALQSRLERAATR